MTCLFYSTKKNRFFE